MSNIRLSPQHGLNPSAVCFFCGEDTGELIIAGEMRDDAEAPHRGVWTKVPCDKCKSLMEQGIMFIECRNGESGQNPYRTGRMTVLKEHAVRALVKEPLLSQVIKRRVAFIEQDMWERIMPNDGAGHDQNLPRVQD